jgi:hypothetical protein
MFLAMSQKLPIPKRHQQRNSPQIGDSSGYICDDWRLDDDPCSNKIHGIGHEHHAGGLVIIFTFNFNKTIKQTDSNLYLGGIMSGLLAGLVGTG